LKKSRAHKMFQNFPTKRLDSDIWWIFANVYCGGWLCFDWGGIVETDFLGQSMFNALHRRFR